MSVDAFVENLSFDDLILVADMLGLVHEKDQWLDDEYPDKEDELRVKVTDAIAIF